ncbi:hypothetical protein OHA37_13690 [Streptomyces sp. NBC_00335]|uniref:hypothetical protein n=1 Tax=unclassified Streptomyces TaxID=2593676 RepID=UPI00225BCF39|nr:MULTISPECIES: hypothetical protein [unclassified Streptomyces]MCX5404933.1 hypothetical protein [Streptomyces sp. NBC_00086]
MRAARAIAGVVLSVTFAAGCSSADGTDGKNKPGGPFGEGVAAKPLAELSVPAQYDGSKGWDETLGWVPDSVSTLPFTDVPRADLVAMLYGTPDGYTVQAKAASDGKVGWSSAPWKIPTPIGAGGGEVSSDEEVEIPDLLGFEQDGKGYVIAWAHGMSGKDALHEGTEVVRLAVFPADAKGSGVKPMREMDVPVSAKPHEVRVSAEGGRVLVAYGERGPYPRSAISVDVLRVSVSPYKEPDKLLPQCAQVTMCNGSRVMAISPDGPLVSMGRLGQGFGMPGRWFSDTVRPDGAQSKSGFFGEWNGRVYGVAAGRLLASWDMEGKNGASRPDSWSVHDVRTGAVLARMECAYSDSATITDRSPDQPTIASPSGRYLAAGPVAFDLERKQGICLEGDGNRKTINLASIRDDGTAFGVVANDDAPSAKAVYAQVDLNSASGDAKVLDAGVDIPVLTNVGGGSGLFLARDDNMHLRVSLRRGH